MSWPLPQDFNEAIQNPQTAFTDPDLRAGQPIVGPTGVPLPHSGNFADVYQILGADGREWAVKCFTRPVFGLETRYERVAEALADANLPFGVHFTYLEEGIRVRGAWRPAVKMEWVEGRTLNQAVAGNTASQKVLAGMVQLWVRMCRRLREARIAHADLQHGNVLLVPGSKEGKFSLKLIDYDGMWVPSLAESPSGEAGHPNYQHPMRVQTRAYSPDLDRFPHLVIATALTALVHCGPGLWDRYDTGDNLLFVEKDFQDPAASPLMRELWASGHPAVQSLVGRLAVSCTRHIAQTPWLDDVIPDGGEPLPLSADDLPEAETLLAGPPPVVDAVPVTAGEVVPESVAVVEAAVAEPAPPPRKLGTRQLEPLPRRDRDRDEESEEHKASTLLFVGIGAGALLLAVLAVVAVLLIRGKEDEDSAAAGGALGKTQLKLPAPMLVPEPPPRINDGGPKTPRDPVDPKPPRKPGGKIKEPDGPPDGPPDKQPPPPDKPVPEVQARQSIPLGVDPSVPLLVFEPVTETFVYGATTGRGGLKGIDLKTGAIKDPPKEFKGLRVGGIFPLDSGAVAVQPYDQPGFLSWNLKTGKSFGQMVFPNSASVGGGPEPIVGYISPNARFIVVSRNGPPDVVHQTIFANLYDLSFSPARSLSGQFWKGGSVLFTPDSSKVLIASYDGTFQWFRLLDGGRGAEWRFHSEPFKNVPGEHQVGGMSADGAVIGYLGRAKDTKVKDPIPRLIDGRTGDDIWRFDPKEYDSTVPPIVTRDGKFAVLRRPRAGNEAATVFEVVDVKTGMGVARMPVPTTDTAVTCVLTADGKTLAVYDPAAKACTLHLFDMPGA